MRTNGKLSEQGVAFKLPLKRISFFIGPASCTFTQDAIDWPSAEETIKLLSTLHSTLAQFTGVAFGAKKTTIAIHLELLRPFFPTRFADLERAPLKTMAIVGKWEKRRVTVDGSASLANGVFVRFEREFDAPVTYEDMAHQLRQDE